MMSKLMLEELSIRFINASMICAEQHSDGTIITENMLSTQISIPDNEILAQLIDFMKQNNLIIIDESEELFVDRVPAKFKISPNVFIWVKNLKSSKT